MDNFLNTLPQLIQKRKPQIGRGYGSGRGAKSGRGTTRHQASREKIKEDYEGGQNKLTKKFPLLRGKSKNKSVQSTTVAVSLSRLERMPSKTTVTLASLIKAGIISKQDAKNGVKIVSKGVFTKNLIIEVPISKKAAQKVAKSQLPS